MEKDAPSATRILVVDDQPLIGELLCDVLRDDGFEPLCFYSAHEAVDAVERSDHIDAVITDIDLGEDIDGFDLARLVRQHCPSAAVIYVSGAAGARFAREKEGGSVFLDKPYFPSQLSKLVHSLLDQKRSTERSGGRAAQ